MTADEYCPKCSAMNSFSTPRYHWFLWWEWLSVSCVICSYAKRLPTKDQERKRLAHESDIGYE